MNFFSDGNKIKIKGDSVKNRLIVIYNQNDKKASECISSIENRFDFNEDEDIISFLDSNDNNLSESQIRNQCSYIWLVGEVDFIPSKCEAQSLSKNIFFLYKYEDNKKQDKFDSASVNKWYLGDSHCGEKVAAMLLMMMFNETSKYKINNEHEYKYAEVGLDVHDLKEITSSCKRIQAIKKTLEVNTSLDNKQIADEIQNEISAAEEKIMPLQQFPRYSKKGVFPINDKKIPLKCKLIEIFGHGDDEKICLPELIYGEKQSQTDGISLSDDAVANIMKKIPISVFGGNETSEELLKKLLRMLEERTDYAKSKLETVQNKRNDVIDKKECTKQNLTDYADKWEESMKALSDAALWNSISAGFAFGGKITDNARTRYCQYEEYCSQLINDSNAWNVKNYPYRENNFPINCENGTSKAIENWYNTVPDKIEVNDDDSQSVSTLDDSRYNIIAHYNRIVAGYPDQSQGTQSRHVFILHKASVHPDLEHESVHLVRIPCLEVNWVLSIIIRKFKEIR